MYVLLISIPKCKGIMRWGMAGGRLVIPTQWLIQSVVCGSCSVIFGRNWCWTGHVSFLCLSCWKKEKLGSVSPSEVLIWNSYFETFSSLMYFTLGTYYCGKILSCLCKGFCQSLLGYFNFSFTVRYSGILWINWNDFTTGNYEYFHQRRKSLVVFLKQKAPKVRFPLLKSFPGCFVKLSPWLLVFSSFPLLPVPVTAHRLPHPSSATPHRAWLPLVPTDWNYKYVRWKALFS